MSLAHEDSKKLDVVLWSIALPGFGQLRNGDFFKALLFIALEVLINMQSNLNTAICYTFNGDMKSAVESTNYQWFLFYPCIYLFAIWDAYVGAGGGQVAFSYFPFVLGAYSGTIGVIFSTTFSIAGILLGPIWSPILFIVIGVVVGIQVQKTLLCIIHKNNSN